MIQITGLRPINGDYENQFDGAFFKDKWRAPSVAALLGNLDGYLNQIPAKERWNLFFTANVCTEHKREFHHTDVLWFDLDGIDLARLDAYIDTVCETLHIKKEETGIVCSGNGLHFYVGLNTPIADKNFFTQSKDHYRAVLELIGNACMEKDLPIKLDPSVFNARQIMRLPGTENRKPHKKKAPVKCYLINGVIKPTDFSLAKLSNIPLIEKTDGIDIKHFEPTPGPIIQGCEFLKYCKEHSSEITEPEWYAALSITARLKGGRELSHEISSGHPKYSFDETERKINQAVGASGPRKCSAINAIWGNCGSCKHNGRLTSPIQLTDPNDIKTKDTGFHTMVFDKKTQSLKVGVPEYDDLKKFFELNHPFKCTERQCWVFNGTHYEMYSDSDLNSFPEIHFNPKCRNNMAAEFKEKIYRSNIFRAEDWDASKKDKVNFQNGVLDLKTRKLLPHSPEYGFKSVLPYAYDASAVAPTFKNFLGDITRGSDILQRTLLEFCGYAITNGPCIYQKALVLVGVGRNGKSTFIETLKATVGEKAYSALAFKELDEREARVALDGALFNITEETPAKIYNSESFKNLITGGELNGRRLFKDSYKFKNRAKLIFSCNALPITPDNTSGMFRRMLIVPFNANFDKIEGNVDLRMGQKLLSELPGIFNMFLEAWENLEKRGYFAKEDEPDVDLKNYKLLTDPVAYWHSECVREVEGAFTSTDSLFKSYRAFCEDTGYDKTMLPKNQFIRRLHDLVPRYELRETVGKVDGKSTRGVRGLECGIYENKEY